MIFGGNFNFEEYIPQDTCDDPWLGDFSQGAVDLGIPEQEPYCPERTSWTPGGDGATCLCPYSSSDLRWTRFAAHDPDGVNTNLKWARHYGDYAIFCAGRCGGGCNSADREAFQDCLDHDSCVTFAGGPVAFGSDDCSEEFEEAADDYIVSYGWCCCTCNAWIGCFC